MLNIYNFLNKRKQIERFTSWTKKIIFGIINNEIQNMDFKLVVCVQVKYRNQKIKDKEFEKGLVQKKIYHKRRYLI